MARLGPFAGQSVQESAGVSRRCGGEGLEVEVVLPPGVRLAQGGEEGDTGQGGLHHLHPAPRDYTLYYHPPHLPPLLAPSPPSSDCQPWLTLYFKGALLSKPTL